MSHMATNIGNGTWNRGFCKSSPNPPELSEHMCAGLAMLFKGEAQALSFMKAATGGSAPASIKSRLAVGVVKTMMQAFEHLSLTPESLMRHADLLSFVHVTREFYTALAYQHSAQAYVEKTEVGNAIAFCLAAKVPFLDNLTLSLVRIDLNSYDFEQYNRLDSLSRGAHQSQFGVYQDCPSLLALIQSLEMQSRTLLTLSIKSRPRLNATTNSCTSSQSLVPIVATAMPVSPYRICQLKRV